MTDIRTITQIYKDRSGKCMTKIWYPAVEDGRIVQKMRIESTDRSQYENRPVLNKMLEETGFKRTLTPFGV